MQLAARELLDRACRERASDIHICVRRDDTETCFRIDNDLIRVGSQSAEYGERLLAALYAAMTSLSDSPYQPTQRQETSMIERDKLPPMLCGARIATAPTSEGPLMVIRLLYDDNGEAPDLHRLGFSEAQRLMLDALKEQPTGMNIISGPSGSGRSTTLQRVLAGAIEDAGNTDGQLRVLTVEEPVEYRIKGAIQTSLSAASQTVGAEERARLFSAAIGNAMRLDPDTIMVGEMRDLASAQNALRAAITGHQVWTSVQANSALAIIDRLIELGLPMNMVADHQIVTGLISQRLIKLLCPHCKVRLASQPHALSDAMLGRVKRALGSAFDQVCIAGSGCAHCRQRGSAGCTVVAEVIQPDAEFFDYIRAGEKMLALEHWRRELGGRTLQEHALEKIEAGLVDPRVAEKVVGYLSADNQRAEPHLRVVESLMLAQAQEIGRAN